MKRLVLCCDGTWNRADQEDAGKPCPTNVIKIAYRLCKKDPAGVQQIIYYDQGVGTGDFEDKVLGGATGAGLEQNIHDAYIFLLANYEPGDEIYILGFSRGAFTARSIGGMIHKCGILKREHVRQYIDAERLYHNGAVKADDPPAKTFRTDYSIDGANDTPVQMIGVWDTVGALGIPLRGLRAVNKDEYQFLDTDLNPAVEHAFHALAIDEHRTPFEPTLWKPSRPGQDVQQVWFPGVHSDVGGGYNTSDLSDITLQWMMDRAKEAGLVFDDLVLQKYSIAPKPEGVIHDSMTLFYRLDGKFVRPIDAGDSTQKVHQSAIDRWDRVTSYRPDNLRKYFASINDNRANA